MRIGRRPPTQGSNVGKGEAPSGTHLRHRPARVRTSPFCRTKCWPVRAKPVFTKQTACASHASWHRTLVCPFYMGRNKVPWPRRDVRSLRSQPRPVQNGANWCSQNLTHPHLPATTDTERYKSIQRKPHSHLHNSICAQHGLAHQPVAMLHRLGYGRAGDAPTGDLVLRRGGTRPPMTSAAPSPGGVRVSRAPAPASALPAV